MTTLQTLQAQLNSLEARLGNKADKTGGLTGQVVQGYPVLSLTDASVMSCGVTSISRVTAAWPVSIGDPNVGTLYRVKASGTGTQGSTPQNLFFDGNNANPLIQMTSAVVPASSAFSWEAEAQMRVTALGSSGTADCTLRVTVQTNSIATTSNSVPMVQMTSNVTLDTTIAQTVQIRCRWASTTGAPTITCYGSSFERLGP